MCGDKIQVGYSLVYPSKPCRDALQSTSHVVSRVNWHAPFQCLYSFLLEELSQFPPALGMRIRLVHLATTSSSVYVIDNICSQGFMVNNHQTLSQMTKLIIVNL